MPQSEQLTQGLPPICGPGLHTLILGSLPSRRSLELGQYYGHPQHAFWKLMGRLVDAGPDIDYDARKRRLIAAGIGVWDVLRASVRPGSMDVDIDFETAVPNDFPALLAEYPGLTRIFFNGRTAADLFAIKVQPDYLLSYARIEQHRLPSTSPAYASMPFEEKLDRWSIVVT